MPSDPAISIPADLVGALAGAARLCALTGAGVSAESGVPTFRDALTGLWSRFDAEQLATPEAFARDPGLVARWYDERRVALSERRPNAAHEALARLESALRGRGREFTLVTQNVDRLHQAAGSAGVIELHGSLHEWRCVACGESRQERGGAFGEHPPRCVCGGMRRPGVVWFGEALPVDALEAAQRAARACDLMLVIGTSSLIHPAAGLALGARASGARVCEINPETTSLSRAADWSIRARAGSALPALVEAALGV